MTADFVDRQLSKAWTSKGSDGLSAEELLLCLDKLDKSLYFVQSMEAFEIVVRGIDHPMRLDFSILGLGYDEDPTTFDGRAKHNDIAREKALLSLSAGIEMEFIIWLDVLTEGTPAPS